MYLLLLNCLASRVLLLKGRGYGVCCMLFTCSCKELTLHVSLTTCFVTYLTETSWKSSSRIAHIASSDSADMLQYTYVKPPCATVCYCVRIPWGAEIRVQKMSSPMWPLLKLTELSRCSSAPVETSAGLSSALQTESDGWGLCLSIHDSFKYSFKIF